MGTGSRPLIGSLLTPRRNTSALSSPKLPTLLPWGRRLRWKIASPPFATAHPHALVILDAKRGDIGDTAALYAREAFERYDADAVTVNPYLGTDSLEPFLAYEDRATVVLCRTSNVGEEFQAEPSEAPLYLRVARCAAEDWSQRGNVMLVAGATHPAELAEIRRAAPTIPC